MLTENMTVYGNSLVAWGIAIAIAIGLFVIMLTVRNFLNARLRRRADKGGRDALPVAAGLIGRIAWPFLAVVAIYAGSYNLDLPPKTDKILGAALVIVLFGQLALIGTYAFVAWAERYERRTALDSTVRTTLGAARFLGQGVIWLVAVLLALDNLGFDITALIAGLGIGGIAIAFALQSILSDLFASVSIILDKPFEVGDFIIVGDMMGTVERVGIKTTRVRSLSGEQLVFSNSDLLQSRIRNYKRMSQRRVVFAVRATYQTPLSKVQAIPEILRQVVETQERVQFDRAHFQKFGDFSLDFEVVYYVLDPDYNLMMDIQQAINLAIYRRFAEEGIEFADLAATMPTKRKVDVVKAQSASGS